MAGAEFGASRLELCRARSRILRNPDAPFGLLKLLAGYAADPNPTMDVPAQAVDISRLRAQTPGINPSGFLVSIRAMKRFSLEVNPMKRILLVAFLTIAAGTLAVSLAKNSNSAAPGQAGGSIQDEIKKLEQERNQAIVRNDAAALDRMSSADYTVIPVGQPGQQGPDDGGF